MTFILVVLQLCFLFVGMLAPSSFAVPSFTKPVFQRLPEEIDSSDDDVLPAWSELLPMSEPHTADAFSGEMGQAGALTDLPGAGLPAWAPMTADELCATTSSVRYVPHSAGLPCASDDFEAHCSTSSDSSEDDDPDIAAVVHSSPSLPPGANPLDFLSRVLLLSYSFISLLIYSFCPMFLGSTNFFYYCLL